MNVVVDLEPVAAEMLRATLGPGWQLVATLPALRQRLATDPDVETVVVGARIDLDDALDVARTARLSRPYLGVILVRSTLDTEILQEALRSGVREVVVEHEPAELRAAVRRSLELSRAVRGGALPRREADAPPSGRMLTVFAAKGGCGKTTFATNLACALAGGGRREVCLIDLDLAFGDVAIFLQLYPAHTIAEAVPLTDTLDEDAVAGLLTPHSPGLSTLVPPVEPGAAETTPARTVATVLRLLKRMFAYVIVDTPPAFTDHVLAAFDESDLIALMATLDIPALKNLKLTLETLDLLNYPRERWRVILNRADSKVGLALSEVEKTLRVPISGQIPSSRDVPASVNRGVPLVLDAPRHPVSESIRQFAAQHVLAAPAARISAHARTDRRGGLLHRRSRT